MLVVALFLAIVVQIAAPALQQSNYRIVLLYISGLFVKLVVILRCLKPPKH